MQNLQFKQRDQKHSGVPWREKLTEVSQTNLFKVRIIDAETIETVWASRLDDDCYRLESLLFFVYGYALGDIVSVTETEEQSPVVRGVVRRSGHSCYRVFLSGNLSSVEQTNTWPALTRLGCTYERATERLFAIDVPAETNIHSAYQLLNTGEKQGEWSFEEVYCGHNVI